MSHKKMGHSSSSFSWNRTYNEIKNKHDQAFSTIDQAISLEEREKPREAIEKYKEGIRLIDEALNVQVQCPDNPDITWEKACVMIQKIKKARAEVLTRINSIQDSSSVPALLPKESPPSYDEAVSSSEDECPITYVTLATALRELSIDPNQSMQEEVIYTHDCVRVYFISPNGEVTSTRTPEVMKISLVEGLEPNAPRAVLQIGTWVYPLVPGVSPCYRTNYGAFILPDLNATVPGSSVGIILPSDADLEVFDLLESILHGIISSPTGEAIQDWRNRRQAESPTDYSTRISTKLVDGAWFVSQGLVKGAQKAGDFINRTTPKLIDSMQSAERPASIPQPLSKGMEIAQTATGHAAKITEFVAGKIGHATMRLGHFLAPHIQKQGTRLLSTGFRMSEQEASDKMKGALTVAAGAVEGFSTIYRGLETSACILGKNLKENTDKVVEHKYGYPASTLTGDTLSTVGNVVSVAHNAKILTPKGLMKNTGRGLVYGAGSYRSFSSVEDMAVDSSSSTNDKTNVIDNSESKSSFKGADESKKG